MILGGRSRDADKGRNGHNHRCTCRKAHDCGAMTLGSLRGGMRQQVHGARANVLRRQRLGRIPCTRRDSRSLLAEVGEHLVRPVRTREPGRRGGMLEVTHMPGTQAPQSVNIYPDNSVTRHERRPNAAGNPLHCMLGYRTTAAQFGNGRAEATTYLMPREIAGSSKRPDMGLAAGT